MNEAITRVSMEVLLATAKPGHRLAAGEIITLKEAFAMLESARDAEPLTQKEAVARLRAMICMDYKQKDMARDAGVTTAHVSYVLNGHSEPSEPLLKLAGLVRKVVYVEEGKEE